MPNCLHSYGRGSVERLPAGGEAIPYDVAHRGLFTEIYEAVVGSRVRSPDVAIWKPCFRVSGSRFAELSASTTLA